jgi:hypothetical protein
VFQRQIGMLGPAQHPCERQDPVTVRDVAVRRITGTGRGRFSGPLQSVRHGVDGAIEFSTALRVVRISIRYQVAEPGVPADEGMREPEAAVTAAPDLDRLPSVPEITQGQMQVSVPPFVPAKADEVLGRHGGGSRSNEDGVGITDRGTVPVNGSVARARQPTHRLRVRRCAGAT